MTLRITFGRGYHEVASDLPPHKWLSGCARMEVEGVVFLSYHRIASYGPHPCQEPVVLALAAVVSVQVAP